MPTGLQIFDASGNAIVDTTSRLGRIIGSVSVSGANPSGTATNSKLTEGTPFYFLAGGNQGQPTVAFSGSNMNWTQQASYSWVGEIYYGVF